MFFFVPCTQVRSFLHLMSSNDLIPADVFAGLPSTQMGDDSQFQSLSQASEFLRRIQLISKGKYVDSRQCQGGDYAVIIDGETAKSLGDTIDILVLARRPKALDMSDVEAVVSSYDPNSDLFKDIQARSAEQDSGCQYGVSFLIAERSTACCYEFFCGSVSLRRETDSLWAYSAKTAQQIEQFQLKGYSPGQPKPLTLKSKNIRKKNYSWFVPVLQDCSTPFNAQQVPSGEVIKKEIERFLNPTKNEETTVVKKDDGKKRRAR